MPSLESATPRCTLRLFKTIERKTIDGQSSVSTRYQGKSPYIDLTPYLDERSRITTTKSVREPAGGFSITFADKAEDVGGWGAILETIYGLVEPMDMVEIRMWSGLGAAPAVYPIVMRGFISDIRRSRAMSDNGIPTTQVIITGQDYGKIWQIFQVIYLAAYAEREALLTNFGLWELFGVKPQQNAMSGAEFIRAMVDKILTPHLQKFMPPFTTMPNTIQTGDSISVQHGVVNYSYQQATGSLYSIMVNNADVGVWNELYTEDRETGVHCVYRAIPALSISVPNGESTDLIQDDAPEPIFVDVPDTYVQSMTVARSDANVANFYWVNNSRFDLIDDMQRKLASIPADDGKVSTKEYPNTAVKYYGIRKMEATTQMGEDSIEDMTSSKDEEYQSERSGQQEAWIDNRRRIMIEMNRDNVVFESGSATIKGGLMRPDGIEMMKAGDYALFTFGRMQYYAYIVSITHDFAPFVGYTTTINFERGTGFILRTQLEGGITSPYLVEQATRGQTK